MDPFRINHSSNSRTNLNGSELQRRKEVRKKVAEADENEFSVLQNGTPTKSWDLKKELKKNALFLNKSSAFKKKILTERKEDPLPDSFLSSHLEITPQSKLIPSSDPSGASGISPISLNSYDPITNYTSPRPKFLRYNPNQRRELLQRIEGEKMVDVELRSTSSFSSPNASSQRGIDSDFEEEEELEKVRKPWYSCMVWTLSLIFGVLLFISYCMSSASYPSSEGYKSSSDNIQKIQGQPPHRLVGKKLFPEKLLGSLMILPQMCLIIGESTCNLDEKSQYVSFEMDGIIGIEQLREGESFVEGIRSDMSGKNEVLVAEVHDLLLNNEVLLHEEHDEQDQRDSWSLAEEGNGNKSISGVEILKENTITFSSAESLQVSPSKDVSDSLFTNRDDKFHNERMESDEFSWTFRSNVDENTPQYDQGLEDFEFSLTSNTELKTGYNSNVLSEGALGLYFIFLGSLTVIVGLLSGLCKYFRRPKLNSLHVFPSPSSSEFCPKAETEEKIVTIVPMKEKNLDKALDISAESKSSRLNVVHSPLDYINVEFKEASGFGPPRVELLGELSLIDDGVSNNGFGSKLRNMDYSNSQLSYYQKGRARKMFSPAPDMFDSSPPVESTSFSSKVLAGEASDTSTTSLRRSSRLRNRVTTP